MTTTEKAKTTLTILQAVMNAIREAGAIPSGHLYSILMTQGCDLQQYELLINTIKKTGLVIEKGNLLYWIEPK